MKLMTKTSIAIFTLSSFTAIAGEKVDAELPASTGDTIDIEHLNGIARIEGWEKELVQVKGELDDNAEEFIFKRTSRGVKIKVEMPRRYRKNYNNDDGDDLVIMVPRESRIDYDSVNAKVEVRDIQKAVSIDTVNGEIDIENVSGKINLESVNGDITSSGLQGVIRIDTVNGDFKDESSKAKKLIIETVNGDIETNIDSSEVRVESVNGDIELELKEISRLELTTVNGEIDSSFTLSPDGDVMASSVGGKIKLAMQENVSASFDIEAHAGGKIVNKISQDEVKKPKYGPSRWLKFSTGDAAAKVEVSTVSGKINIEKH